MSTLGTCGLEVQVGPNAAVICFDVLPEGGKAILGKRAIGQLDLLVDCCRDRLLHIPTKSVVPCFNVKPQDRREQKGKGLWTSKMGAEGTWVTDPQTNSCAVLCGDGIRLVAGKKRVIQSSIEMFFDTARVTLVGAAHPGLLQKGFMVHYSAYAGEGIGKRQKLSVLVKNVRQNPINLKPHQPFAALSFCRTEMAAETRQKNG